MKTTLKNFSSKKCSFQGCDRPHHAKGLCHSHDAQARNGKPLKAISFMKDQACEREGCESMAKLKGKCQRHYNAERSARIKLESAHPCEVCADGVAYLKSRMCDVCKSVPKLTAADRKAKFAASRGGCEAPGCERLVAAKTARPDTLSSRLCERHAADASSKTLTVDAYVKIQSVDACEACGGTDRLVIDHGHSHHDYHGKMCPECIRGRLCNGCNSALGMLGESKERIEGLLAYISRF